MKDNDVNDFSTELLLFYSLILMSTFKNQLQINSECKNWVFHKCMHNSC